MRRVLAACVTAAAACVLAPAAVASFHLVSIREVAPNPGGLNTAFIELQMYAPGQIQLAGHAIRIFDAVGAQVTSFNLPANAQDGDNQRTYLIGDDATAAAPDLVNQQLSSALGPLGAGGAVCFDTVDCVSWGSFAAPAGTLPSVAGSPAPAIPDGQSLTRSIAPGCATLLEAADDSDDSATDFALASPTPRPNSVTPTETACGGGGVDTDPPQTKIRKAPKGRIDADTVKVRFKSDEPGSSFECKLDRKPYRSCKSPRKLRRLDDGKHKFRVRATDAAGNTDPSPAKAKFKIVD